MQKPLCGAGPLLLAVTDLDQLSGERQLVLVDAELVAQARPQVQLLPGDVAAPGTKTDEFGVELVGLPLQPVLVHRDLGQIVLGLPLHRVRGLPGGRDLGQPLGEQLAAADGVESGRREQLCVSGRPALAGIAQPGGLVDLPFQLAQPPAAETCPAQLQCLLLLP